jgi:hypothetical protein
MSAYANAWHGVPIEASGVQQTGRLLEEDNEEWRPMPPVPFGLLPKTPVSRTRVGIIGWSQANL